MVSPTFMNQAKQTYSQYEPQIARVLHSIQWAAMGAAGCCVATALSPGFTYVGSEILVVNLIAGLLDAGLIHNMIFPVKSKWLQRTFCILGGLSATKDVLAYTRMASTASKLSLAIGWFGFANLGAIARGGEAIIKDSTIKARAKELQRQAE